MKLPLYYTLASIGANDWGDRSSKWWDLNNRFPSRTKESIVLPSTCIRYFSAYVFCISLYPSVVLPCMAVIFHATFTRDCVLPPSQDMYCPLHVLPWRNYVYCTGATACTVAKPLFLLATAYNALEPLPVLPRSHSLYCPGATIYIAWEPLPVIPERLPVLLRSH